MKEPLTERQNEVFEFIRSFMHSRDKPPTLREIGDALGIRSTNAVHKHVASLVEKGYLTKEANTSRGIRLAGNGSDPLSANENGRRLPVLGGRWNDVPRNLRDLTVNYLSVDRYLLREASDPNACLVVKAGDDGMNGDGVRKGDLLVAEEVPHTALSNGTLAVFIHEGTFKARRFRLANRRIHLRAADRSYTDQSFRVNDDSLHVVGAVLSVMRTV